ncbi:tyrosine-type recombinase/integrase [Salinisphaera sp. RV14]|uniref:tyrosine-type recombinase/integrase n=1 Tax=Salinisphaera sp. RV14 TaxID=3454140 RepID=UPI003F8750BE
MGSEQTRRTDRIAVFAEQHGIQVVTNKTNVRVSQLPYPALAVMADGNVPKGALVAREIRRSVEALDHLYSDEEIKRLEQLSQLADTFHAEFERDPSRAQGSMHPLAGKQGLSYFHGAFVPRRGEHEGLRILRSLLLRVISAGKLGAADNAARRIRDVLTIDPTRRFDDHGSGRLAEQWESSLAPEALALLLDPYFEGDNSAAEIFSRRALSTAPKAKQRQRDKPLPELPDDTPEPAPPSSDGPPRTDGPFKPPPSAAPPQPTHPGGLSGIRHFEPPPAALDAPPPEEIPYEDLEGFQHVLTLDFYQDEDEPLEVDSGESLKTAAFEFEQATRHHLEGALLPDTDRSLTTAESALVWRHLAERMDEPAKQDALAATAVACAALMLVTGRRRDECIHAITNFLLDTRSAVQAALRIEQETWITTIPLLPPLRDPPAHWFHTVSSELQLPLPRALSLALTQLRDGMSAAKIAAIGQSDDWQDAWAALRKQLRATCPRFTETRCIHTLAVQTFVQTGHLREAQWLSGSSLEHSIASGHYYATPAQRLASIYRDTLACLGIRIEPGQDEASELIGAPRAAINWARARDAIEAITNRAAESVCLTKAPIPTVIDGVSALGFYLALLFAACTAHRSTASIGHITRRAFLVGLSDTGRWGLALVADKTTHPQLDARICALPALFTEQFAAYIRQLERLERLLGKKQNADDTLLRRVRGALSGDGPLWFAAVGTASDADTRTIDRHTLAQAWPEWEIPLPRLRHLFASHADHFGLAGSDIATQMGHGMGGMLFDACDPESPATFAARVAPNLERYIEALGFRSIGRVRRHDPPNALAPVSLESLLSAHGELMAAQRDRRGRQLPEPTDDEQTRGKALMAAFEADPALETDSDWLVEPSLIQQFLNQTTSESLGVQQVVRRALALLITRRREAAKSAGKKRRPFIPPIRAPDNSYSIFSMLHFDAARWAIALEDRALSVLDRGLKSQDDDAVLAGAAILLASYGAGATSDRLLHLLNPNLALHAFERFDAGMVAELPLMASSAKTSGDHECQLLTGDVVALVTGIRNRRTSPPTPKQIETALSAQPELRDLLPKPQTGMLARLLTVIGLARQCVTPGTRSAWERGELDSVGPSLSRLAPLFSASAEPAVPVPAAPSDDRSPADVPETPGRRSGMIEYRRLRRLAHELAVGGQFTGTRHRLVELGQEFALRFGSTSVISLLAEFVIYLRQERGLADSTAYDYLTTIGARLIRAVGAGDVHAIETEALEQAIRNIAVSLRSGDERPDVGAVAPASAYFSDILDRAGVELDLSRAFDGLTFSGGRRPGYFATQTEIDATESRLAMATDRALNTLSVDSTADTATIAEAGGLIQMATGLRLSEVAGLLDRDLSLDSDVSVHVHPLKRRRLKSTASRRLVRVPMNEERRDRLQALLARLGTRAENTGDLLLAPDTGTAVPTMARVISSAFRAAASERITGAAARGHIARHNAATAAVLATHPQPTTQSLRGLAPLAHGHSSRQRIERLGKLPARLKFRYLSRQLGHGTPITTLIWYAHALPLLHAQTTPWQGLTRRIEAGLLAQRPSDIDRWRTHRGGPLVDGNSPFLLRFSLKWLPAQFHPQVEVVEDEHTQQTPDVFDLSTLSCELAACVALTVREGIRESDAAQHWGIADRHYQAIAKRLSEYDKGHHLGYLTGRRIRTRVHPRIPRSHDLRQMFRRLDALLDDGQLSSDALHRWVLHQLSRGGPEFVFDAENRSLADVLCAHPRISENLMATDSAVLDVAPSDRQLVLLVSAVISWLRRN